MAQPADLIRRIPPRRLKAMAGVAALLLALALGNLSGAESTADLDSSSALPARGRRLSSSAGRRPAPAVETLDDAEIRVRVRFDSCPSDVKKAVLVYVRRCYPAALPYLKWNADGSSVSASSMGASGSITFSGSGPTVVDVAGDIGFPASIFVSEKALRQGLGDAIRDIRKKTS
jgi:hypothetical protein